MAEWIQSTGNAIAEAVNAWLGPAASFMEGYVWAWPEKAPLLAVVLLGTGLYVTIRLAFVQIRGFRHAINITRGVYDNPEDEGDLNHFQALTTALSATVGIGNIAGVAIAVRLGGPGALFWMWVTAFFGMALKYAECTLALKYRVIHPDGSVSGGPMYYIKEGLSLQYPSMAGVWRAMAFIFALFAMIASFGGGCMNQSNTLATRLDTQFGIPTIFSAIIFATLLAVVIIGGIKRIGRVTSILAPGMALLYVGGALVILFMHMGQIPSGFATIFTEAFAPKPLMGGAAGSLLITMMWGIRRGLFSNEAGQGSAPIAHATAKTDEPVREGLVASLEPFIDTLVICTMTGLVIVVTGGHLDLVDGAYLTGADLTAHSFGKALGGAGDLIVTIAVVLFAVSTGISWSYYGDRATEYVFGSGAIPIYRWVFVACFFLGSILPLQAVWTYGDVALGLMSFPNLIALILLSGSVVAMTRKYFSQPQTRFKK